MLIEREVIVEGKSYCVLISNELETLLAAKAAGRVVVGLEQDLQENEWLPCDYIIQSVDDVNQVFLERMVRRNQNLPWEIASSKRLILREFTKNDWEESKDIFESKDLLESYIEHQYKYYEYGIWAVVRKLDQRIIGKVGYMPWETEDETMSLELGYQILEPYRRNGYAKEACQLAIEYAIREWQCKIYARVEYTNSASIHLLDQLGFTLLHQKYKQSNQQLYQYVGNY